MEVLCSWTRVEAWRNFVKIFICLLPFDFMITIFFFTFFRRKCASPNTLSVQVPVFSNLGQSLPNLNQMTATVINPPSNMLLAPPKGFPPRGTSYPPPSPPLRRTPALTFTRNPPLLKTRHISCSQTSSVPLNCDSDITSNTSKIVVYNAVFIL